MTLLDSDFGWFSPNIADLPGGGTLKDLTDGLGAFVLIALLLGLVVSCGSWALGVGIGNLQLAERGKQGAMTTCLIALLVGASGIILSFFYSMGQRLH